MWHILKETDWWEQLLLKSRKQSSSEGICAFTSCGPDADQREPAHTFLPAHESPTATGCHLTLLPLKDRVSPGHTTSVQEQAAFCSWVLGRAVVPAFQGACREAGVGGGWQCTSAAHLPLPTSTNAPSARAEVPLTGEQKGDPGEGMFLIHLLPGPCLCALSARCWEQL